MFRQRQLTVTLADVKKRAHILVIDDQEWPTMSRFENDRYHIERWPEVKSLESIADGRFQLVLLDIHGVGLEDSPDKQGLGILEALKRLNPALPVILYSAAPHPISVSRQALLADKVFDKSTSYIDFQAAVDELLVMSATPEYFIAAMNRTLGVNAALAPKSVSKALVALRKNRMDSLRSYLTEHIPERETVEIALRIIGTGAALLSAIGTFS